MYYLRKDDRAIYKHRNLSRWYRGAFTGLDGKYQGMHVYRCKTLKRILELRRRTHEYSGEYFDVYDANGIVQLPEQAEVGDINSA